MISPILATSESWPDAFSTVGIWFAIALMVCVLTTERWPWDRRNK